MKTVHSEPTDDVNRTEDIKAFIFYSWNELSSSLKEVALLNDNSAEYYSQRHTYTCVRELTDCESQQRQTRCADICVAATFSWK